MYQFNPSLLKEKIIPDNTENAEAFLYEYTNLKNNMKNATMFGWHAYLDDEIYYSNIVHPNNNWSAMPGSDNQWRRFKEVVRFGVNKNPYTRGIECPFSK